MKRSILSAAVLGVLGFGVTFSALALEVNLCAGSGMKTLPDSSSVTIWGYNLGATGASDASSCNAGPYTSPGPRITVPVGEDLTIHLHNGLPRATSLVIPGTVKGMAPTFFTSDDGLSRVRSFDVEAGPAGGSADYTWSGLAPGSYLYHSGTHSQVQVQMGLFGAATKDSAAGEAYGDPAVAYDEEVILFYSEVDRDIHDVVDDPLDGNANTLNYDELDMQSTVGYAPKHFMIDADASSGVTVVGDSITLPEGDILLRLYNAGLQTHVPTVIDGRLVLHAEDGKQYPSTRQQYSVLLPALTTKDAMLTVSDGDTMRLTDSAMALSSATSIDGGPAIPAGAGDEIANGDGNGMALNIQVGSVGSGVVTPPSENAPVAREDSLTVEEGGAIGQVLAQALSNDSNAGQAAVTVLSYPKQGELIADGDEMRYEHDGGEEAQDSLVYQLTNASGESSRAGVVINVVPVNDAPQARDDTVATAVGQLVEIRALSNDEDPDSRTLAITGVDTSTLGTLTANSQVIVFEATTVGAEDVAYTIADASGAAASAVLHLSVAAAAEKDSQFTSGGSGASAPGGSGTGSAGQGIAPEAKPDAYTVAQGQVLDTTSSIVLGVLGNDSSGVTVNTRLVEYPAHGSIRMGENGTFVYTHDGSSAASDDFVYEIFNELGSAQAQVTITVNPATAEQQAAN